MDRRLKQEEQVVFSNKQKSHQKSLHVDVALVLENIPCSIIVVYNTEVALHHLLEAVKYYHSLSTEVKVFVRTHRRV